MILTCLSLLSYLCNVPPHLRAEVAPSASEPVGPADGQTGGPCGDGGALVPEVTERRAVLSSCDEEEEGRKAFPTAAGPTMRPLEPHKAEVVHVRSAWPSLVWRRARLLEVLYSWWRPVLRP